MIGLVGIALIVAIMLAFGGATAHGQVPAAERVAPASVEQSGDDTIGGALAVELALHPGAMVAAAAADFACGAGANPDGHTCVYNESAPEEAGRGIAVFSFFTPGAGGA